MFVILVVHFHLRVRVPILVRIEVEDRHQPSQTLDQILICNSIAVPYFIRENLMFYIRNRIKPQSGRIRVEWTHQRLPKFYSILMNLDSMRRYTRGYLIPSVAYKSQHFPTELLFQPELALKIPPMKLHPKPQ